MADPAGVSLAIGDDWATVDPAWDRIDDAYNVQSWQIDRGRQNEMGRTDTGTASIQLVDTLGDFDPTNTGGAYYGLAPLTHAAICLQNPADSTWHTLFRGYVSQIRWVPYQNEKWANVTLDLVDALALFAACEMPFDGTYGDDFIDGNIVFNEDTDTDAVRTRMINVLTSMGWPSGLRFLHSANVGLQQTVYAPRSTVLQVLQDAADAEFPDIANLFVSGPSTTPAGKLVFHGRFARFHPDVSEYNIGHWKVGDDAAAAADPSHVVRISPPLEASLDDTFLYTSALATPQNIDDGDIPGQYVQDAGAVGAYGLRTWSAENLATRNGAATSGEQETGLFAEYVLENFKTPRVRVGQLTVKGRNPATTNGAKTWQLLCGIDISDLVHLKTTHRGGGGFDDDFFVEGIHYTARPGGAIPVVELTLDVSPKGYYDENPFE